MGSLNSVERKFLFNADSSNVVYSQGYLLFLRETTLMAQPFDAQRLVLTGDAFPIAENIRDSGTINPSGIFSVSENGVLVYQTGTAAAGDQLLWFDRTGKQMGVLGDPALYSDLELSPDGKRASFSIPDQAGKGTGHLALRRGARPANALHIWSRPRIYIHLVTRRQPNCFQLKSQRTS